ncbi:MAG: SRPBCC family protein [Jiangellaceae bacterium]
MASQRVSGSVIIDAPAATVFAIVADPHQHSRIDGSGSVRGIVDGPRRLTRGATFAMRMRLFGLPYRITNRVVEYERDRLIAWRHFGAHRWRYELEALSSGGTRVTETFDYSRYRGWVHVLRLLRFPERNRRGIERTLPRLKAAAEADARTLGNR